MRYVTVTSTTSDDGSEYWLRNAMKTYWLNREDAEREIDKMLPVFKANASIYTDDELERELRRR